jgi:peptide/nickel transport system permease protein
MLALIVVMLAVGLLPGPDPNAITSDVMLPPSIDHLLGTDELGRDVLVSIAHGIKVLAQRRLCRALAATMIGILVGSMAGAHGGVVDLLFMRISEIFQVVPSFILAAVIVALSGPGLLQVVAVISLLAWPQVARLMRGEVMRIKQLEFVDAVRCLGVRDRPSSARRSYPTPWPLRSQPALVVAQAILLEAALSFFGLSSVDIVSWGGCSTAASASCSMPGGCRYFPAPPSSPPCSPSTCSGDALGSAQSAHDERQIVRTSSRSPISRSYTTRNRTVRPWMESAWSSVPAGRWG